MKGRLPRQSPAYCECGNERGATAPACDRCRWLDGYTGAWHRLIWALRQCGRPATAAELGDEIGVTANAVNALILRAPPEMVGRVRCVYRGDGGNGGSLYALAEDCR